jgi:hypothetical protein
MELAPAVSKNGCSKHVKCLREACFGLLLDAWEERTRPECQKVRPAVQRCGLLQRLSARTLADALVLHLLLQENLHDCFPLNSVTVVVVAVAAAVVEAS